MFQLCLEALISSVISVNSLGIYIDYNNGVTYHYNQSSNYAIYDKYNNLELCKSKQRFANINTKSSDIINQIKTIE